MLRTGHTFYKIMDTNEKGEVLSLFHGTDGSRVHPMGRWLMAQIRPNAVDGAKTGTSYRSGFHIMESLSSCLAYLDKFHKLDSKVIVRCRAGRLSRKEHSPAKNLWLAEAVFIDGIALSNKQLKHHIGGFSYDKTK